MPGLVNEMAENWEKVKNLTGVWFAGARCLRSWSVIFEPMIELHMGSLGVWAVGPGTSSDLSTGYPQDIVIKEFGSLTRFCLDQGPRAVLHKPRAQDPRCYGPGPWFLNHETV